MKIIDTHTHIYVEEFDTDRDVVIQSAKQAGIAALILPNVDVHTQSRLHALCDAYPDYVFPAMGIHPTSIQQDYLSALQQTESILSQRTYCAIGEIGIDLYWSQTHREAQIEALK